MSNLPNGCPGNRYEDGSQEQSDAIDSCQQYSGECICNGEIEETTSGRWCIESVCRYLGIKESNNVKCDFRGSLYGTQETINSTRPDDFVHNNQAIGLSRRVYDTIGSDETRIDQILNNPATPADQFTRSGILNGVYAVLKASNNQSQETQQILSKLSQEGITGRFESAILGQVNQLRNYAQKFSTQNFA